MSEIIWGCETMSMGHLAAFCAFPFSFQVERRLDPAEPLQSSSREGLTLSILCSHRELRLPDVSAGLVHQPRSFPLTWNNYCSFGHLKLSCHGWDCCVN